MLALRKNRSMRVPVQYSIVYRIDSIAPRTSVRIRQSGRTGIGGRDNKRMPFGLCNASATFQRCMLSIFSDLVERIMEVYMDDITVYGGSFEECLINLETVLHRCIEKNLVLN